jgi:antitoxin CptB
MIDHQNTTTNHKRLLYRSKNRGCKENDLILGNFAEEELFNLTGKELIIYESFLDENDNDILLWLIKDLTPPQKYIELVTRIKKRII